MAVRVAESLAAALRFAVHVVVAAILFGLISGAAVALNQLTLWFEARNLAPNFVLMGMLGLEYVTWAADIACFGWFVIAESIKLCILVFRALRD